MIVDEDRLITYIIFQPSQSGSNLKKFKPILFYPSCQILVCYFIAHGPGCPRAWIKTISHSDRCNWRYIWMTTNILSKKTRRQWADNIMVILSLFTIKEILDSRKQNTIADKPWRTCLILSTKNSYELMLTLIFLRQVYHPDSGAGNVNPCLAAFNCSTSFSIKCSPFTSMSFSVPWRRTWRSDCEYFLQSFQGGVWTVLTVLDAQAISCY